MLKHIKKFLIVAGIVCAMLIPASPAYAGTDPFALVCDQSGTKQSVACQGDNSDPLSSQNGILKKVTIIIAAVAGFVAVIAIVVGGIRLVASNGDAEQVGRSKRTILYAVIGLVVIALGQTIIIFILNRI